MTDDLRPIGELSWADLLKLHRILGERIAEGPEAWYKKQAFYEKIKAGNEPHETTTNR